MPIKGNTKEQRPKGWRSLPKHERVVRKCVRCAETFEAETRYLFRCEQCRRHPDNSLPSLWQS